MLKENRMKAAVYHGVEDLRIIEVPKPVPAQGEVLVKINTSLICATDIKMFKGVHSYVDTEKMLIFGHENAGVVSEIGPGVDHLSIGERVFIAPNIGCGRCRYCINGNNNICHNLEQLGMSLNGGFAEYMLVPKRAVQQGNLMRISETVQDSIAALTEPLACVLRGQKPLKINPETIVLIIGGGPIGMLHLKLARLKGAAKIIVSEPNAIRRERAVEFGADIAVDSINDDLASIVYEVSKGVGADVVITTVPSAKAQVDSINLAAVQGRVCFFAGLPKGQSIKDFDSNLIHYKELQITGTSGNSTADCNAALSIINANKIDLLSMITAAYKLNDIQKAFEEVQKPHSLKIAIHP